MPCGGFLVRWDEITRHFLINNMGKLRSLSTAFWSDPFVEDLSPNEKLLFIYLITNEKTNMLGIYEASVKKISFETGIEKEDVDNALKSFERIGKVKYINNYVLLVNFLKHQNFNTNMKKSAIDVYNNLPKELKCSNLSISKENTIESFETLLNHFGMVRKVEVETEVETEVEIETKDLPKKDKSFSEDVLKCYGEVLNFFPNNLHPDTITKKNNWLDTLKKLNEIDKIPFEIILEIIKKTRADDFWSGQFLSIPKLRKNNPDGIKYIVLFNEKFNKQKPKTINRQTIEVIKSNADWS